MTGVQTCALPIYIEDVEIIRSKKRKIKKEYVETITKPIVLKFRGKDGKLIKFNATKVIKKPATVNFHKIKKRYK